MSSPHFYWRNLVETVESNLSYWFLILLGSGLGVVIAYLLAGGYWYIALGLFLALPGFILLQRYPLLGLMVWLILEPFLLHTQTVERHVYWVIHRALPPLAVVILIISSTLGIYNRKLPRLGIPEFGMAGYVVLSLISIFLSNPDPLAYTYLFYDRVFSPMCLYLIIRLAQPTEKDYRRLILIIFFLSVSQSIIGLLSRIMPQILPSDWLESAGLRTTGSLVNTSVYTTTLVFAGLLLLHYALNRKPGLVRTLFVSAFLLALFCIFLSFSRSSWLGGILVVLGLLFVYPKFTVKLSLIILFAVLLATTGRIWINEVLWAQERLQSREAEQSALSRLPVYYASVRMFEAKPLFGWGYGNFDYFDRQFQGRVVDIYSPIKDHASHNLYLTILAEQGVIGLSFFLIPLICWYALSLRVLPSMPREGFWSKKLLIILWLVILIHIVVNNFFNMRVVFGLGMWWVTLGLIANLVYIHLSLAETAIERRRVSENDRVASR